MSKKIHNRFLLAILSAVITISSVPFAYAAETEVSNTVEFGIPETEVSDTVEFGTPEAKVSDTVEMSNAEETVAPRASNHPFDNISLGTSRPSGMTFTMNNVVFQNYATIGVSGTCSKPGTVLSFELYRKVSGSWVLISSSQRVTSNQGTGIFSWSTSYGASGEYGIKAWGATSCSISGNLIY